MNYIIITVITFISFLLFKYLRKSSQPVPKIEVISHTDTSEIVNEIKKIVKLTTEKIAPKYVKPYREYRFLLNSSERTSGTHDNYTVDLYDPIFSIEKIKLIKANFKTKPDSTHILIKLSSENYNFNSLDIISKKGIECFASLHIPPNTVASTFTITKDQTNAYYKAYEGTIPQLNKLVVKIKEYDDSNGTISDIDIGDHTIELEITARVDKSSLEKK